MKLRKDDGTSTFRVPAGWWRIAVGVMAGWVACPGVASPDAVAQPAARPGAETAITRLTEHLERHGLEGVAEAAFASTPLTKAEATQAAGFLTAAHRRQRLEWLGGAPERDHPPGPRVGMVQLGNRRMPYWYSVRGPKPPGGRSLFISLHGGGAAPPAVNTAQWENQKRLYAPEEGVYLVPRAPGDTWDLWHQDHVDRFLDRMIQALVVLEDVDPDRVYLMGYSAGGDGVYQLAPRMADRFAAAAMMAGHPNETRPDGLRNLPFAIWVGENDTGYQRHTVARAWADSLAALRVTDPGGYLHQLHLVAGKGHWMDREDAAAVPWLATHTRTLRPDRVVWLQDDVVHRRFYWLKVSAPRARARLAVALNGQRIELQESSAQGRLKIRLDDTMLDLDSPVEVLEGERIAFRGIPPRTIATLAATLAERGDPRGLFSAEIEVALPEP